MILVLILFLIAVAFFVLAPLPGRIARNRNHPYGQEIKTLGWVGIFTFGVLWWIVLIWAFKGSKKIPEEVFLMSQKEKQRRRLD